MTILVTALLGYAYPRQRKCEHIQHSTRARSTAQEQIPWTEAFGALRQNDSHVLFKSQYISLLTIEQRTCGMYDAMVPRMSARVRRSDVRLLA
jgi:hypothetical protein